MNFLRKTIITAIFSITTILCGALTILASETSGSSELPTKILFIGNSSTYYNSMPQIVKGLAEADGRNVNITVITASNYKLSQFSTTGNTYYTQILNALAGQKWDYVVLQDHRDSIIQDLEQSENAIKKLKTSIDNSGAQTVLYETQADFSGKDFTVNDTLLFLDHTVMQYYMTQNYFSLGNKFDAPVSCAGVNYTRCMNLYPEINLYNSDLHHPSLEGSYLAACTLYQTIFDSSAFNNGFLPGSEYDTSELLKNLDYDTAIKLQNISDPTLKLNKHNIELQKGKTATLTGTFNISSKNLSLSLFKNNIEYFSLAAETVAVNRYSGTITAIKSGNTMVMATTDSGLMSMCTVSVKQPSTAFTITDASIAYLHRKDSFTYKTTLAPDDTTDKIKWVSSVPSVATVDENGTVTAKKIGVSKITATTDSGIRLTRSVRVKLITPAKVQVKKLSTKAKSKKYANVYISWKKNTNAAKYYVYRSIKKGSGYNKIATTTKPSYTDKNKKIGKTFYYKIRAVYSNTKCNSYRTKGYKITLK